MPLEASGAVLLPGHAVQRLDVKGGALLLGKQALAGHATHP